VRAWGALLAVSSVVASASEPRPSAAALRKAFESNRDSVVEVVGPHARGAGVVVGAAGQVLTSVSYVGLESATVRVADKSLPAKVLMANATLKVAVVSVGDAGVDGWRSAPVALSTPLTRGMWVVGLKRARDGSVSPLVGQVSRVPMETAFVDTDLRLPPGSPLFDSRGRMVAITVQTRADGSRALPLPRVKGELIQESEP
jgi:hypothetical protein